jgi:WD40 repeat protein
MNERDVFIDALQLPLPAVRREFLDDTCAGQDALRRQVESLLAAHDRVGQFLEEPLLIHIDTVLDAAQSADGETEEASPDASPPGFLLPAEGPDELGRLGHYRVLRLLGRGGMGLVYLADDTRLERPVALKVMRPELAADSACRERFLREGRAAARVRGDHVVKIYHVGQEGDHPYLVMELLAGRSLADVLEVTDRLSLGEALRIARETAEGLAAAHASGLIHRDVKPGNVWLEEPGGRVKLLDFGLARAPTGPSMTQRNVVLGTPAYMAPEQALGQRLDERCDLFSLGAILFQMLTGRRPFAGDDLLAVLANLARGTDPPSARLGPDVPGSVGTLLDRLLAPKPEDRPGSAARVAHALREIERELDQLAPTAEFVAGSSAVTPVRRRSTGNRRRVALTGLGGVAVLLIGLGVAAIAGAFRASDEGSDDSAGPETGATTAAAGGPAPATVPISRQFDLIGHGSQVQAMAFTADSRTLISAEYRHGTVVFWDFARRDAASRIETYPGGTVQCMAVDPRGHWLATAPSSPVGKVSPGIRLFRVGEERMRGELQGHTDRVEQLVFLRDGKTLLSAGFDGSIRSWDVEAKRESTPLRASGPRIDSLNVWEDPAAGPRLALGGQHFVSLNDLVLERFPYGPGRAVLSPDGTMLACSKQDRVARPNMTYVAMWRVPDTALLGDLPDAPLAVGLAFTPDGRHVIVVGSGSTIVYAAATRREVARITPPGSAVSVAVSPDGSWLAIGTLRGEIHVWHLPTLLGQTV